MDRILESNEIYIYGVGIVGLVLLVSARLPIFSDNIGKFFASLRRTAQNRDDADIAELKRTVENMEQSNLRRDEQDRQRRTEEEERRELLQEHALWDRNMYRAMQILLAERSVRNDISDTDDIPDLSFPPPLF